MQCLLEWDQTSGGNRKVVMSRWECGLSRGGRRNLLILVWMRTYFCYHDMISSFVSNSCQMKDGLLCISGRQGVSLVFHFISWERSALSFPPWVSSYCCFLKMKMPSSKEAQCHPPEFIPGVHFHRDSKDCYPLQQSVTSFGCGDGSWGTLCTDV